jgi:hypothetical protein
MASTPGVKPGGNGSEPCSAPWGHSSFGRASAWQAEGEGFDPPWLHSASADGGLDGGNSAAPGLAFVLQQAPTYRFRSMVGREALNLSTWVRFLQPVLDKIERYPNQEPSRDAGSSSH